MRALSALTLAVFFGLTGCDTGGGDPIAPAGAGYQQVCDPAMGVNACQTGYFSQAQGRQVGLQCYPHMNGPARCTYTCTPRSLTECDAPSPKCNGMGVCADPGEHGQNNP